MIPSLEGWPTKAKEAPSLHEVRLTLLDTNPVFLNGTNPENIEFQAIWGSRTGVKTLAQTNKKFGKKLRNKIRIYLIAKLNTQKNIHSNLFLLQKKHTRTNLNLLNATAYQRLSEYLHISHLSQLAIIIVNSKNISMK